MEINGNDLSRNAFFLYAGYVILGEAEMADFGRARAGSGAGSRARGIRTRESGIYSSNLILSSRDYVSRRECFFEKECFRFFEIGRNKIFPVNK